MTKTIIVAIFAFTLSVYMTSSLAADSMDKESKAVGEATSAATHAKEAAADGEVSVMDQPVDFSTPEAVEESIEKVRQEAGDDDALKLKNALGYILAYDLSFARDKEKMYKKLNGRTPNAIIAKAKR